MPADRASLYPGPMGWVGDLSRELRLFESQASESPQNYQARPGKPYQDLYVKRLFESLLSFYPKATSGYFHNFLGMYGGPAWDIQRLPEQIIGSCVASGGLRAFAYRTLAEVLIYGQFELLMGRELTGPDSVASYGPYSYGWGRKIAGIKGSDGSLCAPHIEGFLKYGALDCNTAGLVGGLPEPSSASLYREWGNWQHIEDFVEQGRKVRLLESAKMTSVDQLWTAVVEQHKPCMICSNWGFQPIRFLAQYGMWEYGKSGTWAHNMTIGGGIDFAGDRFFKVDNSWPLQSHKPVPGQSKPGEDYSNSFFVPGELMHRWLADSVCMTIGEIDLEDEP